MPYRLPPLLVHIQVNQENLDTWARTFKVILPSPTCNTPTCGHAQAQSVTPNKFYQAQCQVF